MKTVQMTLDEKLIRDVDKIVKKLKTNRSAFARTALARELKRVRDLEKERKHRKGYIDMPEATDEYRGWEQEQEWPDW